MFFLIKHIIIPHWKVSRPETVFFILAIIVFGLCLPFPLYYFTHKYSESPWIPYVTHGACTEFLWEIMSIFLPRALNLHELVYSFAKTPDMELRISLGDLIYHFLRRSHPFYFLYTNIIFSKLKPHHIPVRDRGQDFEFVRHEGDFVSQLKRSTRNELRQCLKDNQIDDFTLIQKCIKKDWKTVAYKDMHTLLETPDYFSRNIWMANGGIGVTRLFIFPYFDTPTDPNNTVEDYLSALKKLNKSYLAGKISKEGNKPTTTFNNAATDPIERTLRDAIYLKWLVDLHQKYEINYFVVPRHETKDSQGRDAIGIHLLQNWTSGGSAIIDEAVIVRFDDRSDNDGYIAYTFCREPSQVKNYLNAFNYLSAGPEAIPRTYRQHNLKEFFMAFFSRDLVEELYAQVEISNWIPLFEGKTARK